MDIIRYSREIEKLAKHKPKKAKWVWIRLDIGCIKVNVDSSYKTDLGKGGIEGVFRDADGRIFLQFSKEVSVDLVIHAELLAIWKGLLLAATSRWVDVFSFTFELDSKTAVIWLANPTLLCWQFQNLM